MMPVCKGVNYQTPHLLSAIYPDQIQFNLTEGKMAIYGDGIQKKILRLAAEKLNFKSAS